MEMFQRWKYELDENSALVNYLLRSLKQRGITWPNMDPPPIFNGEMKALDRDACWYLASVDSNFNALARSVLLDKANFERCVEGDRMIHIVRGMKAKYEQRGGLMEQLIRGRLAEAELIRNFALKASKGKNGTSQTAPTNGSADVPSSEPKKLSKRQMKTVKAKEKKAREAEQKVAEGGEIPATCQDQGIPEASTASDEGETATKSEGEDAVKDDAVQETVAEAIASENGERSTKSEGEDAVKDDTIQETMAEATASDTGGTSMKSEGEDAVKDDTAEKTVATAVASDAWGASPRSEDEDAVKDDTVDETVAEAIASDTGGTSTKSEGEDAVKDDTIQETVAEATASDTAGSGAAESIPHTPNIIPPNHLCNDASGPFDLRNARQIQFGMHEPLPFNLKALSQRSALGTINLGSQTEAAADDFSLDLDPDTSAPYDLRNATYVQFGSHEPVNLEDADWRVWARTGLPRFWDWIGW